MMKENWVCKVCRSAFHEDVDMHILFGFSFSKVLEDFNERIVESGERPLNLKDLSLHKNRCLLPLSDAHMEMVEAFGVELRDGVFVNPELNNKTVFRRDVG